MGKVNFKKFNIGKSGRFKKYINVNTPEKTQVSNARAGQNAYSRATVGVMNHKRINNNNLK